MFKGIKPILYAGREVLPLYRGRQGRRRDERHISSGAWAAAGGIGTVSAVNADGYDPEGRIIPQVYHALTRRERHEELIRYAIDGAVPQVQRAYDIASGRGAININVLWEMGGAQRVLQGVLEKTKGLVSGVTCGAGMPYKLSEIAASHKVTYLPIISSARAFCAFGSAPITRPRNGCRRWSTRIPGWPAAITVSPMPRTARAPGSLSPRQGAQGDDAHRRHLGQRADRDGGRRLESEGMGPLDRQ